MSDISIIIAHRDVNTFPCTSCEGKAVNTSAAAPLGLWATIHSIMEDLDGSGLDYEFCIYTNGTDKVHNDTLNVIQWLKISGKTVWTEHSVEPVAPPLARQKCTEHATGKLLFFFDNHILVKPGYFKRAIESMEKYNMDMLHSTTRFFFGEKDCYHYSLTLKKNFWATACFERKSDEPYLAAAGGHGGFVVRRDVWEEVGGYGWDGFVGYGGEEIYFDFKMWLLGKKVWLDPKLLHYHYAGSRGYKRHYTDDFFKNMIGVANIIGGTDWMYKVQDSFNNNYFKSITGKSIFDLMTAAESASKEHAEWLSKRRNMTLNELLAFFIKENIAY